MIKGRLDRYSAPVLYQFRVYLKDFESKDYKSKDFESKDSELNCRVLNNCIYVNQAREKMK